MFASYESISILMHLLLILAGIVIVTAMMFSNLIINFPRLFLGFVSFLLTVIGIPIIEILGKIFRSLALEFLFDLILALLGKFCSHSKKSIGFILIASLVGLILLIAFQESSLEGIIIFVTISFLVIDKIFAVKRTKLLLKEAKQFEKAAISASKRRQWYDTLTNFGKALDIYKHPFLAKNPKLDVDRAKLLEKMAIVLNKNGRPDKALLRLHQALDIYRKPHLIKSRDLKKCRVRVLEKTAAILYELGRRSEAKKRYELVSELTGKTVTYFG